QLLLVDAERFNEGPQRFHDRMGRLLVEQLADLHPPPGKLGARELRVGAFVHYVVHLAAEGVQRGDGAPALRRQEQERIVETRSAGRGLALAVLVRTHSALAKSRGQSNHLCWGRWRNMS